MAHDSPVPSTIPFRVLDSISGAVKALAAVLVAIGVLTAVLSLGSPDRLWMSLLFNWLFWSSLGIGMVMFAVALRLTNADWAWSIRRFALGGGAFLPISFVLLPVVLFGGYQHYFRHWLHADDDMVVQAKSAWLNWPGLGIRDIVAVAILYTLAFVFMYHSLRTDLHGVRDSRHSGLYERMTRGYRGVQEEAAHSWRMTAKIGTILGIVFTILWGMISIDMAMSLDPHWFSTMFPVNFFWAAFHGGVAVTAIAVILLRKRLGIEEFITRRQYHDLGKLLFAFSTFWMYLHWGQYIVIWYGQLPFEQQFFVLRFAEPFGSVTAATVILVFLLPFFGLLTSAPKRVPQVIVFFSTIILLGHWLERYLLIYPSLWEEQTLPLGLPEIGIAFGFGGLFLASYLWFLGRFPLLPSPATLAAREATIIEVPTPATTEV